MALPEMDFKHNFKKCKFLSGMSFVIYLLNYYYYLLRLFKGGVIMENPRRTLAGAGQITSVDLVTLIRSSGLVMTTSIS